MRTFISVPLPEDAAEALDAALATFRRKIPGARWTEKKAFHFTLKFLGESSEEKSREARERLRTALPTQKAFSATWGNWGAFPSNRSRILWLSVDQGRKEMTRLAEIVEAETAAAGFPRETRPFSPHLTVGRHKFAGVFSTEGMPRCEGGFTVGKVCFVKSDLFKEGPIHTVLEEFGLLPHV